MAHTVDELAEILEDMRDENQRNNDNFEKVLTNINAQLELMAEDNEATDLLKLYINELKKSVDEKHNVSLERFKLLDKAFEQIISDNVQLAKVSDLKELYDVFSSSLGSFSVEMVSQKEAIENIFGKIDNVKSSILDKDELASLLNDLSASVATMSMSYNGTLATITEQIDTLNVKEELNILNNRIDSVIASVESVPAKISFEPLQEKLDSFRDVTESVKHLVEQNVEKLSAEFIEKFDKLERDFDNIVTESDFAGFRTNLADFVQKIIDNSTALNTELSYSTERIENILATVRSLDFRDDFENVISRVNDLKETFEEGARVNYNGLHSELTNLSQNFENSFKTLDSKRQEVYIDLKNELSRILDNLKGLFEQAGNNESLDKAIGEISTVKDSVSQDITSAVISLNENADSNYSAIKEYMEELVSNLSTLSEEFKSIAQKDLDATVSKIETISSEINAFKNEFRQAVSADLENSSKIVDELISISGKFETLKAEFTSLNDNTDLNSQILETSQMIEELKHSLEELQNNEDISNRLAALEISLSEVVSGEDFSIFRKDFAEFLEKIVDNSHLLSLTAETNKEQIAKILEKINGFGYEKNFDELAQKFTALSVNIDELKEFSSQNSTRVLDEISKNLSGIVKNLEEGINSSLELNLGELKNKFAEVESLVNQLNSIIEQKSDSVLFHFSAGFESLKTSIQDISKVIETANNTKAFDEVISTVNEITLKTEELKNEINSTFVEYAAKIVDSVNELGVKLEQLSGDNTCCEKLSLLNDAVTLFSTDLKSELSDNFERLNEVGKSQLSAINDVCAGVNEFKSQIAETLESLKVYSQELNTAYNDRQVGLENKISAKFLDLESTFASSSQEFEQKIESLQAKLTEFAHIVENSAADTEGKIALSLEEISGIKEELSLIAKHLQASKVSSDDKYTETITLLQAGIENILFNINNVSDTLIKGFESKEEFVAIESNFANIITSVDALHAVCENTVTSFDNSLDEKFLSIKEEISLISSDINDALSNKTEEIIRAFESIKTDLDGFTGFDIEKNLEEFRVNLKESFATFAVDINGELSAETSAIARLEEAYKESYNRIVAIEECVTERLNDNLELLNASIEVGLRDIKAQLSESIDLTEIKDSIEALNLNNSQVINAINNFKEDFSSGVSEFDKNIKNYVDVAHKSIIEKSSEVKESMSGILEALHAKVDVLAMEGNEFDIAYEIDDIKELILEQRKYFESSSDEKTETIDKYLKDVLLKLDNVDLNKSAEDIKESIMNVLLSLVDQISFVEETEEIKDFVEEKTDLINQNLMDVKNQLRQLTSLGDDFDYSYTLQDVESDIARLRLAISNMSGNDFEDFADDIKRIVTSVEGLENSLTQDQIIDLKSDILKLNEDIVSISSRTNKLLLTSDESSKVLSDGLNNFSNVISKLEERLNYFDNSEITERLEKKIDNIHTMSANAANNDKMFHQVMTYLGEWIDVAGENLSGIVEKTAEIPDIKDEIQEIKSLLPEKEDILNEIEHRFEQQEERIDRLEMKLEKVLSTLEQKDDMLLNKKVDKIEKLLSTLSKDIEKLTSYVDEE